jgi:CheY-like chemotaxis protein
MAVRILAADADPVMLEIYRSYFPHFGYEIETTSDVEQCLGRLREFVPEVMILNLELAVGGGEGVLAALRQDISIPLVPVVLTTAEVGPGNLVRYLVPPVVKLLEKPFRLSELRASVMGATPTRLVESA